MDGFRFDCDVCDTVLTATTSGALTDRAATHLGADHRDGLRGDFAESYGGTACENDCGYAFPAVDEVAGEAVSGAKIAADEGSGTEVSGTEVSGTEVSGFDCPGCGHDHFDAFARQYVYWRIEVSE